MPKPPASIAIGVDRSPPPVQLALLAAQYAFLVCVYLVIVVIVVRAAGADAQTARSVVSMAMIAAGAGTALQALHRGPVGSGYLAPPVYSAIYLGPAILAARAGGLPAVALMTVCAGMTEIVVARFLHRLRMLTQPTISGLTICIVALQLGIVGLEHALDVGGERGPGFAAHVAVAAVTFAVTVGLTVWGRGTWKLVCTLLGLLAGVAAALALGLFDAGTLASIGAAPWFAMPDPGYLAFRWEPSLLPAFIAAGLAAAIRTVGVLTTCQKANDAAWVRPDLANIRRGVYADGIGCTLGGLVGAPGMNTGPSLVGVSIATGVTSRSIAHASAVVLVVLAFVPKVADLFLQLPLSVAGGLLVFTASIMLASGMQLMLARPLDTRFTFVIGVGLLFPLTAMASADFFARLPGWLHFLTDSGLALGLTAAIGLLLIFRMASGRRQTIPWRGSTDAHAELARLLEGNAASWGLTRDAIERALADTSQAITLLHEGELLREPVAIRAAERDNTLEIELSYRGQPLVLPHRGRGGEVHEETAVAAGLHDVGIGVFPDRASTTSRGAETILRLGYDM